MCTYGNVKWYVLATDKIDCVHIKQIIIIGCIFSTQP